MTDERQPKEKPEILFQRLYQEHSRPLYSYLLGRTGNPETSADLLQDVFMKIWNRIDAAERILPDERLYWMFSIASNRVKDYYRKTQNHKHAVTKLQSYASEGASGDLSHVVAGKERIRELESHIRELPEELRSVLLMKTVGGMKSGDIGAALGIPAGTVRYRISLARRQLADKLGLLHHENQERKEKV